MKAMIRRLREVWELFENLVAPVPTCSLAGTGLISDMKFKSRQGIKGTAHVQLFSAWNDDGSRVRDARGRFSKRLKDERLIENTVTELMDAHVADQMSDSGDAAIGFMGVGTGSGQGSADVGLDAAEDNNALDSTTQGAGGADNDVVYVCTWAAGDATAAITEAGILHADNNTSLMTYADFSVINKGAADSLVITWTVTFGAS